MAKAEESVELLFAQKVGSQTDESHELTYSTKDKTLHQWAENHWKPIQLDKLENMAWRWLAENAPDKATPRIMTSCAAAVLHEVIEIPNRDSTEVVLPLKNATLEIINLNEQVSIATRAPSRKDGLTYVLNCEYEKEAQAPEFDKFLKEVLPDEDVRMYVQEYIGYTLLPDCRFQRAQFWLGGGSNGKSTLAEIVGGLHENPTALQLDQLEGFNLTGLLGASLVYVDETPARINEQKLKVLISGGLVQVDRKYREAITFRPTAKWIVCGNNLPSISDHSEGFWRRFPIIPFNAHFPDAKQDPLLAKRIISSELSGILNWALEGLVRLLKRGRFGTLPLAVALAISNGKQEANSVMAWWYSNDDHEVHPTASVTKDDVFTNYKEWAVFNGMTPVKSPNFWKRFRDVVGEFTESRSSIGKRPRMVNIILG